ncbi:AAA family ATPase [Paludibacterium sp.]|uniref:ATP-dependent nuclease n=1 Tax=Paludibacterium sp. TaxID=1917523 RepID=UPI0025EFF12B|nr:AAA family ATPase [Paludibacterium sp.]MBV8647864.1 ATP-binding protein [Paludibacterium sp.]
MSGRKSRPDLVRKLTGKWTSIYQQTPYLKSVSLGKQIKLRGIHDSKLEYKFPLTVICGPNGTGKTTFIALSLLAFHHTKSLTLSNNRKGYFDFTHFFGSSNKEKHETGISIAWEYTNQTSDSFTKGTERWIRYIRNDGAPRRPQRGVEFVGLSRIVPAFERRGYKGLFSNFEKQPSTQSPDLSKYLSQVLARSYGTVKSYQGTNGSGVHRLNDYASHTSFNAGAGEECLANILDTLLRADNGAFIAIEEIEIGLHPATMEALVDACLEIIYNKNLQVVITTHSPDFLRACPSESLVLAERGGDKVSFFHRPNLEGAIYNLAGKAATDLYIVCEDKAAAALINAMTTSKQRKIINIKGYGSESELLQKAESIKEVTQKKVLVVWDGDAPDYINEAKQKNIYAAKLPGLLMPEEEIANTIVDDSLQSSFMAKYEIDDAEWDSYKNKISSLIDKHDIFYCTAQALSKDQTVVIEGLCELFYNLKKSDFADLRALIEMCLSASDRKKEAA